MPRSKPAITPASFTTFGELLRYLRRRVYLTQRDLGIATGYSEGQISRLEQNQRLPDPTALLALFVPALDLDNQPDWATRLLELAAATRDQPERQHVPAGPWPAEVVGSLEAIPPPAPYEVARPRALARLVAHLTTERCVALSGLAGMGKTTLAAAYARQHAAREPVFWLTLTRGITTSVEALIRRLALFLLSQGQAHLWPLAPLASDDAPPIPLDQQVALISAAFAQQPALLCFDDLHLVREDIAITALLRYLNATTRVSLLLISREDVPLPDVMPLRLAGLERDEGVALVTRLAAHTPGVETWLKPHTGRLLDRTGSSPMLLKLAMGQLYDNRANPARFIDHLETQPQVAAYVLETVLRDLSPAATLLVELLSVVRQPANLYDESWSELFQEVSLAPTHAVAVAELQRRHLINHPAQAGLHPLVRDHVYATLSATGKHKRRLHYLAARWSEFAAHDMLEAAHHYAQAGQLAQVVEVLADQAEALLNQGQALNAVALVDDLLTQLRQRSKPPARRQPGDHNDLVRQLLTIRGDLLVHTLRTAEAEQNYRQALLLTTQSEVWANIVHRLAGSLLQHGRGHEAARMCREAALVPNHTWLLAQLAAIESAAHVAVGACEEAEQAASLALALANQLLPLMPGLAEGIRARAYGALAETQRYQGHSQAALDSCQQAIAAAQQAGLRRLEYRYLGNMAMTLTKEGRLEEALRLCTQALDELNAIGDSYAAADILAAMAHVHYLRGDQVAALDLIEQAADLRRRLSDFGWAAAIDNLRTWILFLFGRIPEAIAKLKRDQREIERLGSTWLVAYTLEALGMAQTLAGELRQAQATLRQALALPDIAGKGISHALFGDLALAQLAEGAVTQAQQTLDEAPPPVGVWPELDRLLVSGAVALGRGDTMAATTIATALAERAAVVGYELYIQRAARLVKAIHHPPPPAELPRFLWVDKQ
jgi:tetratricopeptide (TPR) repeat protein/transcriptional regulator with XRE-family HTH domain